MLLTVSALAGGAGLQHVGLVLMFLGVGLMVFASGTLCLEAMRSYDVVSREVRRTRSDDSRGTSNPREATLPE